MWTAYDRLLFKPKNALYVYWRLRATRGHNSLHVYTVWTVIALMLTGYLAIWAIWADSIWHVDHWTFIVNVRILLRVKPNQQMTLPHCLEKFKVGKRAKIRNRYNQAPHLTQDTNGKVTTSQFKHLKREPRGQPFPSRWPEGINKQTCMKA